MSHTEAMDHDTAQVQLRDMMSAVSKPARPKQQAPIGTKQSKTIGIVIAQGRVVYDYALMVMGDEAMSKVLKHETTLQLPMGFVARMLFSLPASQMHRRFAKTAEEVIAVLHCLVAEGSYHSTRHALRQRVRTEAVERGFLITTLNVPSSGSSSTTGSLTAFRYTIADFTSRYFLREHNI